MNTQITTLAGFMHVHPIFITLGVIWVAVWKLLALWKAAKHDHLVIFIILGVLNTVGIAEIIYIVYLYFKDKKEMSGSKK